MSHEGVVLIMRSALVLFLILSAAFFRALAGPSRKRGEMMALGFDASAVFGAFGMVLGMAASWLFARRIPREAE